MRNFRVALAVAAIAAIASLSACFPSPGDIFGGGGGGSPASVSGKWSILLSSNHGSDNNVDVEANFSQSTGAISAMQSVILSSSPCDFGTDFIQGTVNGSNISFTLAFGTGHPTMSFSGSVSNNGLSMSGNYKIPSGDCTSSDSGTWAATKFGDSSGSYSGQVTSDVTSRVITVLAAIQEDADNNLAANIALTNGGCSMLNLTGIAIGSVLDLETADQTIGFVAQASDPSYATLATSYEIGGTSCGAADTGSGTLSMLVPNVVSRPKASTRINPLMNSLLKKTLANHHN
ncbi:MAG: hypothetical protein WA718_07020 [Terriglobales bacterium]